MNMCVFHLFFVAEDGDAWRLQLKLLSPQPPRISEYRKYMNE